MFPVEAEWLPDLKGEDPVRVRFSGEVEPSVTYESANERLYLYARAAVRAYGSPTSVSGGFGPLSGWRANAGPSLRLRADWYPLPVPLGLNADVNPSCGWSGYRYNRYPYYGPDTSYFRVLEQTRLGASVRLNVGLNIGRVRDATPVVLALRVEEVLRDEELVRGRLADDHIEEIAERIANRWAPDRRSDYGRGERAWYDSIETRMRGITRNRGFIPARAWLRIRDALRLNWSSYLPEEAGLTGIPKRTVGARLRPLARFESGYEWQRVRVGDSVETSSESDDTLCLTSLQLEAGWPLTTQLHLFAAFNWSPELSGRQSSNLTASLLISDGFHALASLSQGAWWSENPVPWNLAARGEVDWFIVDRLEAGISARLTASWRNDLHTGRTFSTDASISTGLTVRLN